MTKAKNPFIRSNFTIQANQYLRLAKLKDQYYEIHHLPHTTSSEEIEMFVIVDKILTYFEKDFSRFEKVLSNTEFTL